ncbi:MAG: DUF4270 family protein [Vicingaceae bacterium]|nr:DUF4270 family protein [Vicingaceae bacterium]
MNLTFLLQKGFLLSALFLISVLFSCKKDGKISPDFDNGNLSIIYTDTFSIQSTVEKDDPSQTDLIPFQLLGVYNDPVFGVRSSSIYTNVGLTGATDFGDSLTVDSLVLSLTVSQSYGDASSSITANVFELSSPLSSSTSHFSNTYSSVKNVLLGSRSFTPSTMVDSELRIVITDTSLLGPIQRDSFYVDNNEFYTKLSGLHIVTSDTAGGSPVINTNSGAFALFNFSSSASKLSIYYRNGNASDAPSKVEDLTLDSRVKTYSRFINDYSGTDVEKHLNNDPSKNTNRIYVSDMEGTRTKIEIPYIKNLADQGQISINKAEMTFTIETGTDDAPNNVLEALTLSGINSNGDAYNLIDESEGDEHFGGTYNSTSKTISFNITRHIHEIINGTITDYGMYLTPNAAIVVPNRAVFNSENSPTFKTKLEITYSKL